MEYFRPVFSSLCVLSLLAATKSVSAVPEKVVPKTFAVFTTHYNTHGDQVRGGICGTLFFLSPTKAVTAYHVLNKNSFHPMAGFERVRVWAVNENNKPIELKAVYVASNPDKDITIVSLPSKDHVSSNFIYKVGVVKKIGEPVRSEGFIANTADGPVLRRVGDDVVVVAVPFLKRLLQTGVFMDRKTVDLKAADADLKAAPDIKLSYQPIVGISGGPVTSSDGRVVAMNSFKDPVTMRYTWALELIPGVTNLPR